MVAKINVVSDRASFPVRYQHDQHLRSIIMFVLFHSIRFSNVLSLWPDKQNCDTRVSVMIRVSSSIQIKIQLFDLKIEYVNYSVRCCSQYAH